MREFIKNNIKLVSILLIVIDLGIIGVTYAALTRRINIGITTGEYNVVYTGTSTLPSSDLSPVADSSVRLVESQDKVLKIEFTVKGAETNPTDKDIIYDVSLTDLNLPDELKSEKFKWRLYKNDSIISVGNFKDGYDTENENRMVLTPSQQDLLDFSSETADSYIFYAWLSISEACESDITNCTEEEASYASSFMNKTFSGNIRIELSTGNKKATPIGPAGQTLVNLGLEKNIQTDMPDFYKSSYSTCDTSMDTECETTMGIYSIEDDLGISYYFRGEVANNYVIFGKYATDYYTSSKTKKSYDSLDKCLEDNTDSSYCNKIASAGDKMYWRIIRINGDGTVRMIYDGTAPHANGEFSTDKKVGAISFNSGTDNAYVGYMYGETGLTEEDENAYNRTHANINDSKIKMYLEDEWYAKVLKNTEFEQHISDAIYCNNRSTERGSGIGNTDTIYRTSNDTLKCENSNDRFTLEKNNFAIETNGALDEPVGLITYNELNISGIFGYYDVKPTFYLEGAGQFWTMSPAVHSPDYNGTRVVSLSYNEILGFSSVYYNLDNLGEDIANIRPIRPVISLKSDALKYGTGISDDPFRITEAI